VDSGQARHSREILLATLLLRMNFLFNKLFISGFKVETHFSLFFTQRKEAKKTKFPRKVK